MKLTVNDKAAFVRAVLADLPQVDYKEQAVKCITAAAIARFPEDLQAVAAKYPNAIRLTKLYLNPPLYEVAVPTMGGNFAPIAANDTATRNKIAELTAASKAQEAVRDALELSLKGVIAACTTLKQAQERLSEFAKYLPAERAPKPLGGLPVANIIADLTAAGWPKDAPLQAPKVTE